MNREINQKKEEKMVGYDFSIFDSSGSNAGANITKIDDGNAQKRKKEKDNKKKRKAVINVGNGNAVKQAKSWEPPVRSLILLPLCASCQRSLLQLSIYWSFLRFLNHRYLI